jgi:hypothetical protein
LFATAEAEELVISMTKTRYKAQQRKKPRFTRDLPPEILMEIARLIERVPLVEQPPELSPFDALVGKLMPDAMDAKVTKHLLETQREYVAAQADAAGFALIDHLEEKCRNDLASWNKTRSLRPAEMITSFTHALKTRLLRRGVLRRFYRAADKCQKRQLTQSEN